MVLPSADLNKFQIILASGSPRRKQLLEQLGLSFVVRKSDIDESFSEEIAVQDVAEHLCRKKAKHALKDAKKNELIICADTTVIYKDRILGKPVNEEEAKSMLRELSGKEHKVITAVCLANVEKKHSFSVCTQVHMKTLLSEEISYYVTHFQPFDKAGAYGIQEWIGLIGVEKIEGSFYNVMGLPVKELYENLKCF